MRPRIPFPAPEATLARVRVLLISLPNWAITAIMLAFFCAVSYATRALVLRFFGDDDREDLAEQAKGLLTGVAATFAFFVGFAINISWGAVTAGQIAVEQQAAAIQQTAWELDNVTDRAQAAALMDKLRAYATTAAGADSDFLRRGNTTDLPSAVPLNAFEDAVRAYAYGPQATGQQGTALVSAATSIRTSAASVAAVANRGLPFPMVVLVFVVGVLATIMLGITAASYSRPSLTYIWCLIPAISMTVVAVLAYPFALRTGANLAALQAVAAALSAP